MKSKHVSCLLLTLLIFAACETICPAGRPNTTYLYKYTSPTGDIYVDSVKTDADGYAPIDNVPDDFNCSQVEFVEDPSFSPVDGPEN